MALFARINPLGPTIDSVVDIDPAAVASLVDAKRQWVRPIVADAVPTVPTSQVVERGPLVIEPTQVRQTWVVRDKTQAEVDADSATTERATLVAMVAAIQSDIDAGIAAVPTTVAQCAAAIQDLRQRMRRTERVLVWMLRNRA